MKIRNYLIPVFSVLALASCNYEQIKYKYLWCDGRRNEDGRTAVWGSFYGHAEAGYSHRFAH